MDNSTALWTLLASLLILSATCVTVIVLLSKSQQRSLSVLSQSHAALVALADKQTALLSAKDAMTFQALQVMNQPSGYDDADGLVEDEPETLSPEDLDAQERFLANELGIEPEFLR